MKKVKVKCPSCSKMGIIEIDESLVEQSKKGIASLNVPELLICPHSFVAYVDKNFMMRDSFTPDFMIELPQINMTEEPYQINPEIMNEIDLYLIKLNLKEDELANILNCILIKKDILFINDSEVVVNQIANLIKFLFFNTFEHDFSVSNRTMYIKNKKKYKNHIIVGMNPVLRQQNKEKFSNKTKIENIIVRKFWSEPDSKSAIIIFKNEINKSFLMSKSIIEILQNYPDDNKISKKNLVDFLSKEYDTKIQFEYLEFLLNIVKYYFGFNLSRLSDYFFPSFGL
ncbi:MAG: hypothetical protein ACFFBP_03390 [Promethearchaeota archaeon]